MKGKNTLIDARHVVLIHISQTIIHRQDSLEVNTRFLASMIAFLTNIYVAKNATKKKCVHMNAKVIRDTVEMQLTGLRWNDMKNREKYAEELLNVACTGKKIAIDKRTMQIRSCAWLPCEHCLFNGYASCDTKLAEWAESEYIELPAISKKDRAFLDCLIEEYKFIARDKNGMLFVYEAQPIKMEKYWYLSNGSYLMLNRYFGIDFPMVKWSDAEPWKIDDLKKLEVVDEY